MPVVPASPAVPAAPRRLPLALLLALLLGLALGGGLGWRVVGPQLASGIAPRHGASRAHGHAGSTPAGTGDGAEGGDEGGDEAESDAPAPAPPPVEMVGDLVLNPSSPDATRFLLVSVGIQARTAAVADRLRAHDPLVRDALISYLSRQPVEQLADITQRPALRDSLRAAVARAIGRPRGIQRIYLPQFVIQ